jgi:hypothetical protein
MAVKGKTVRSSEYWYLSGIGRWWRCEGPEAVATMILLVYAG